MTWWPFVDGRLLLHQIDWRTLSPSRLVNVLSWLMMEDASTSKVTMGARRKFRDLLDGLEPEESEEEAVVEETPVSDLGIPVGLREAPLGTVMGG